ncbi:hypothetical protein V1478_003159 [Vespula squamosa]|uniref:Uncharacterized protein n=1 Tax=Vespula squamosa TaxID=30214 RepID=A0ABD2BRW1_VESSQ
MLFQEGQFSVPNRRDPDSPQQKPISKGSSSAPGKMAIKCLRVKRPCSWLKSTFGVNTSERTAIILGVRLGTIPRGKVPLSSPLLPTVPGYEMNQTALTLFWIMNNAVTIYTEESKVKSFKARIRSKLLFYTASIFPTFLLDKRKSKWVASLAVKSRLVVSATLESLYRGEPVLQASARAEKENIFLNNTFIRLRRN